QARAVELGLLEPRRHQPVVLEIEIAIVGLGEHVHVLRPRSVLGLAHIEEQLEVREHLASEVLSQPFNDARELARRKRFIQRWRWGCNGGRLGKGADWRKARRRRDRFWARGSRRCDRYLRRRGLAPCTFCERHALRVGPPTEAAAIVLPFDPLIGDLGPRLY